jgi:hypothetical protein
MLAQYAGPEPYLRRVERIGIQSYRFAFNCRMIANRKQSVSTSASTRGPETGFGEVSDRGSGRLVGCPEGTAQKAAGSVNF